MVLRRRSPSVPPLVHNVAPLSLKPTSLISVIPLSIWTDRHAQGALYVVVDVSRQLSQCPLYLRLASHHPSRKQVCV